MSPCLPQDRHRTVDTSDRHIFSLITAELHLFWMMTIVRNLTRGQLLSGPRQEQSKSLLFTSYQLGFVSQACRLSLDGIIQYKICVSVTGGSGECRPPCPVTWHTRLENPHPERAGCSCSIVMACGSALPLEAPACSCFAPPRLAASHRNVPSSRSVVRPGRPHRLRPCGTNLSPQTCDSSYGAVLRTRGVRYHAKTFALGLAGTDRSAEKGGDGQGASCVVLRPARGVCFCGTRLKMVAFGRGGRRARSGTSTP